MQKKKKRNRDEFFPLVKEGEKNTGFKPHFTLFSFFLCLADGKSGAENCFAQSHTLAVIELADSTGLNRKCNTLIFIKAILTALSFFCPL